MLAALRQSVPRKFAHAGVRSSVTRSALPNLNGVRFKTTISLHSPAADSPREAPTPLVLISALQLLHPNPIPEQNAPSASKVLWKPWLEEFNRNGWSAYTIDLDLPKPAGEYESGDAVAKALESELITTLANAPGGSVSPPAVISRGPVAALAAQTYIASNPASALLLIDPALSYARLTESPLGKALLPSPPSEPRYEVTFPAHVAWSEAEENRQKAANIPWYEAHHIEHAHEDEADAALDKIVWPNVDTDGPLSAREWLEDEAGL